LSTFILKNPPDGDSCTPQKLKKLKKEKGEQENGDTSPNDESGFDGWSDEVEVKNNANNHHDEVDDWSADTSEEAVQKRMAGLGEGVKGLTFNNDLEKSVEERFNIFFKFVKNKINEGVDNLPDKEILAEAERLDIKDRGVMVLAELLFNEDILNQIPKHRKLFLRFLNDNQKAQKNFLGAFELTVGMAYPNTLIPKAAHILKTFYDLDLVEEEILIEWGAKVSKKYVSKEISEKIHAKATPFIDWLKIADEESEESEDDEVEVVYTTRTEEAVLREEAMKNNKTAADDDDDDLDIDDI